MREWFHRGVAACLVNIFCLLTAAAQPQSAKINMIKIQDSINPGVQDFIERAVKRSAEEGAECLIILLDTPGGLMTSMRGIVQEILNAPLPVVVYVSPGGAQAASAGVLITIAADIAAMAPGTNIGAAHPVSGSGEDIPKTMNEKVLNDMLAFGRSIARERARNADWVAQAIRESASITAEEAFAVNVIDVVAQDLDDLCVKIDGWEIERPGYRTTLRTKGVERHIITPGWRESILRNIGNPNIAYILLMIGLAGLYFELSHPGAIFPGVIGAISLVAAFYALQTLPVNAAGFLFLLLAVLFFILEIKVASYGLLSIAGTICLVLGSVMLFRVPGESQRLALAVLLPTVLVVSGFFVAVAGLAFRAQMRRPATGSEALIGAVAEVKQDLAPQGKVFVAGELWNAEADEFIPSGTKVRIVGVANLKLKVQRIGAR
jgi:membrane-bound serine protease (ClpP class)